MKKIFEYSQGNVKFMVLAVICLLFSTIFCIIPYYLINNIVVNLMERTFVLNDALKIVVYACIFLVLKSTLFGAGLSFSHIGAFNTLYRIRNKFASDMARHPMGHILQKGTGQYKKGFVEDVSSLESALAHMIPEGVPYIFVVLLTIIAVFFADYRIGIALVIMIPISMSPMAYMMKVGLEKMPMYYESRSILNNNLIEFISGMEVIKIFNKTDKTYGKLHNSIINALEFTIEWCKVTWKAMSVLYSALPCTLLLPLPTALFLFSKGEIDLATVTLTSMLALSIGEPLIKLINFMPSIPLLGFSLGKVDEVFNHEDVQCGTFNEKISACDIKFENVRFGYNEKEVIKGISFDIPSNSICALVGPSGGGKSTLVKLLLHFWDINEGSIKIGGKDLKDFTFSNLMDHITYVSQENTLFEGTILDNILIANENLTREDAIEACKKANCHDFISKLPHGYDTNVGALGSKLSGGERQRITIARAMIKNAPIVVLDEATAFADAENEFLIQDALSKLLVGKTIIIVAHKLHTITKANKIIVIDDGQIESSGTHESLLNDSEIYNRLWNQNQQSVEWDLGGAK